MVADVSQSALKSRERLRAFNNGTAPYDEASRRKRELAEGAMSIRSIMLMQRRVRTLANTAEALLDHRMADLQQGLGDPERWHATTEALAQAAEAIAQLQAVVARMVPK